MSSYQSYAIESQLLFVVLPSVSFNRIRLNKWFMVLFWTALALKVIWVGYFEKATWLEWIQFVICLNIYYSINHKYGHLITVPWLWPGRKIKLNSIVINYDKKTTIFRLEHLTRGHIKYSQRLKCFCCNWIPPRYSFICIQGIAYRSIITKKISLITSRNKIVSSIPVA